MHNGPFCALKLLNAFGFAASLVEEHPMKSHQPFYDSSSGAARPLVACYQRDARKVIICFELAKLSFSFFNKMYFFIFYHI
jgi:hypothetical protein